MKIGDEVFVHGYVDEIRKDDTKRVSTIIIRNEGGYFGTVEGEIVIADTPQTNCDNCAESGSYKCTKCDGEMYYKADTPQTECGAR